MNIRMLTEEDWNIWRRFRLESLQNSPESFGSSYEEELIWSDSYFQDTLIKTLITHACPRVAQLHLTCVTNNLAAMTLYQKYDFKVYGTEPRALKIGDVFFDEHLMILDLTRDPM